MFFIEYLWCIYDSAWNFVLSRKKNILIHFQTELPGCEVQTHTYLKLHTFFNFRALCNYSATSAKKSSQNGKKYFKFNKKSSTGSTSTSSSKNSSSTNSTSTNSSADSFTTRMRKFVSNGNQNNANAPGPNHLLLRRKISFMT